MSLAAPIEADHARMLRDCGYAVIPGLYPLAQVRRMREALLRIYEGLGSPPLYSKVPQWQGEAVEVSGTGLVLHELLTHAPELQGEILHDEAVRVLRGALGDGVYLEFVGAVIADKTRPFFTWHHHKGGIDDELYRRQGLHPDYASVERASMLVYLDEVGPELGQLVIDPVRRQGPAPYPVDALEWPAQVTVSGPPGTVAIFDQATWHAVQSRTRDGLRMFVGLWFTAPGRPLGERVDRALEGLVTTDPLLASVLEGRPARGGR